MYSMSCSTGELDQYVRDRLGANSPRRSSGGFAVSVPAPSLQSVSSLPLLKKQAVCFARANGTWETKHPENMA